jgi:hypothetical protein
MSAPIGRAEAQQRANRIRAFRAELEALSAAGVVDLSAEEQQRVRQYHDRLLQQLATAYDIDSSDAAGRLSRGMQIASFFAAVALTAAVYSLVARFWGRLDLPMQATLLCAFPLIALACVEFAAQRDRTLYIASLFALVACGTYWLAVFVLSARLSIPVTPPALWGGALFGVALALSYGFRLILALSLLAFLLALAGSVFQASGVPWTAAVEFPEIITVAAFLLVVVTGQIGSVHRSFAPITRGVGLAVGFLGLLILSSAGAASLFPTPTWVTEAIYQLLMLVSGSVVLTVAVRRQWTESVYVAAAAMTVFLFGRYVDWFWTLLPRFVFFLILAGIAFGWLWALRRLRVRVHQGLA